MAERSQGFLDASCAQHELTRDAMQLFKQQLGLIIEGEDEMACMVDGCNFLLNAGEPARAPAACRTSPLRRAIINWNH